MSIANFSDNQWINWFAKGKTEFTGNTLEVIHGTSSELTLGFSSEVFLGTQTSLTVGMKVDATIGGEFTLAEAASIRSKNRDEDYYMTSYAAAVGASRSQTLRMKRLRMGIFVLLGIQAAAMTTAAISALVLKAQHPDEEKDLGLPALGISMAALNHISSILAILVALLIACRKKWFGVAQPSDPSGVLTLDTVGGAFLGTRVSESSAGVMVGSSGVQLSAARPDLGYAKPVGSASIIGFNTNAEEQGGARVEIKNDGKTEIYGNHLKAWLRNDAGPSATVFKAEEHHLLVTAPGSYANAGPGLEMDEGAVVMRHSWDDSFMAAQGNVTANAGGNGGSFMQLKPGESSLSTQGTTLKITPGMIKAGKLTIDQTGLKFGNELVVLTSPAPPAPVNNPQIAALEASAVQDEQKEQIAQQQEKVEKQAEQQALQVQIAAQSVASE